LLFLSSLVNGSLEQFFLIYMHVCFGLTPDFLCRWRRDVSL